MCQYTFDWWHTYRRKRIEKEQVAGLHIERIGHLHQRCQHNRLHALMAVQSHDYELPLALRIGLKRNARWAKGSQLWVRPGRPGRACPPGLSLG
eukprot:scaffold2185_cov41-Prasinocladus_malaysianus.AAC.1